ncbi:MAG: hypothetical protein JNL32_13265 [Candidatus Kapabacteria bacterium]|nr:hypothetical protein [Candidatus Kapabacteria bacterium]
MKKTRISIRTVIFSFLLAVGVWTFMSLRATYEVVTEIPLDVIPPAERSIETVIPQRISVKLRSTGWHLMNVLYVNPVVRSVIRLSALGSQYTIGYGELKQGVSSPVSVDVLDIQPQAITLRFGTIATKKVPVVPHVEIAVRNGYILGDAQVQPDSVVITGNAKILNSITAWHTKRERLTDAHANVSLSLTLSDTLRNIVRLENQTVQYSNVVQRMAEQTFYDIPIEVYSAPPMTRHSIFPQTMSVTVRGGIESLANLDPTQIRAGIEYPLLERDTTGHVVPVVHLPPSLRVISMSPALVRHSVRKR